MKISWSKIIDQFVDGKVEIHYLSACCKYEIREGRGSDGPFYLCLHKSTKILYNDSLEKVMEFAEWLEKDDKN